MEKVLIIDDSDVNLALFKHLVIKLGGCEPIVFNSAITALAWCENFIPDLVIVDYMMPDMDGLQFIEHFRALHGRVEIPVLMVTANDQKDVRYKALLGGANDFLTKPVDRVEFDARTRNMLSLRQAQRFLADRALHLQSLVDEQTWRIRQQEQELIYLLSRAAEYRDPETGGHVQRMAHYSALIAEQLGLDTSTQKLLLQAAPMHDIGKIGIPDHILLKPGCLTVDEFDVMKEHARLGYDLLKGSASPVLRAGAEIAHTHHEKFDGSGYPNGLIGENIPIFGRIVAVADVFDALGSERPYKKAWSLEEARNFLLDGRGGHFDPRCVDAFIGVWDRVLEIRERFDEDTPIV